MKNAQYDVCSCCGEKAKIAINFIKNILTPQDDVVFYFCEECYNKITNSKKVKSVDMTEFIKNDPFCSECNAGSMDFKAGIIYSRQVGVNKFSVCICCLKCLIDNFGDLYYFIKSFKNADMKNKKTLN